MHRACPVCGHVFGREEGFFVGAMYASYFLALAVIVVISVVVWLVVGTRWPLSRSMLLVGLLFMPFVPLVFRYSRVMWMHMDWLADPGPPYEP